MAKLMGGRNQVSHRSETTGSATPAEGRDLRGLRRWHFVCQVTQPGGTVRSVPPQQESTPKRPGHICEPVGTSTPK